MNVGIDVRPLMDIRRSGVGEYIFNLLNALFHIDQVNQYFLFYNSFRDVRDLFPKSWLTLPNVKFCGFHYPNKIFNASLKFLKWPKVDKLIKPSVNLDLFFLPNLNFIALSSKIKKIITVHDLSFELYPEFFSLKSRLWYKMINPQKLFSSCDQIIAVSENTKRDLSELYRIEPEKIKVIYSGVSPHLTSPQRGGGWMREVEEVKKKYNLPEHLILFLGTLEPRKNIEGLIRAFEILKQEHGPQIADYKLVIVGSRSSFYKKIYKRAKNSPFRGDIKFIDYISQEEKFYFYKLADLFVYPSFYEGFGFPPLEAACAGAPVITSFTSSLPEIMAESALLVNPYNLTEIARAMFLCLKDQKFKEFLAEKAKKQIEKFSWEKCAKETLELFNKTARYEK